MKFITINKPIPNVYKDIQYLLQTEGKLLSMNGISSVAKNNVGGVPIVSEGVTTNTNWRSATPATVTANAWHRYDSQLILPAIGRCYIVYSITIDVDAACDIALLHRKINGTNFSSFVLGGNGAYVRSITSAGTIVFEFPMGIFIRSGEAIDLYGVVTTTTGIRYQVGCAGYDITDDFNYDVDDNILVIGDSITITSDTSTAVKHKKLEDGTEYGLWPFIVKDKLEIRDGKKYRLINLGIGGITSLDLATLADQGRFNIKSKYAFINIGVNDASADTNISTSAGVDGIFKKNIKNICRQLLQINPNIKICFNQITATDRSAQLTNVASGIYAGQTRLSAYRQDLTVAISEISAAIPTAYIKLAATDTAYTASDTPSPYISTESAGSKLHPNDTVGQPAIAAKIITALN